MSSLAQGIKLAPMRMGDIKAAPVVATPEKPKAYVPPYKLKGATAEPAVPGPASLEMTDAAFPTLGKSKIATHVPTNQKFKQTILNLIEKDQMEESERLRLLNEDVDPLTVSNTHLEATGWLIRSLNDMPEISRNFYAYMAEQDARIKEIEDFYNLSSISRHL